MLSKEFLYEYLNNNNSGKMSRPGYIIKNFKNDYDIIIKYPLDIPFKEKVYCIINNIDNIRCSNPNCNNLVKFKNSKIGYLKYCSNKCISSDPNIKRKKIDTNIKKFGTEYASQNEKVKEIAKKVYDNRSESEIDNINNKRRKTNLDRYGFDNVLKNKEISDKRIESFKKNIEKWKISYEKSSITKFGTTHPWMNQQVHNKSVISTKKIKEQKLYYNVLNKLDDSYKLINIDYNTRLISIFCNICNSEFEIHRMYLHIRNNSDTTICTICNPIKKHISGKEIKFLNFIKNIYKGDVIINDRNILNGKELDIYLPSENLAFEYNGLYWLDAYKHKNYHKDKTDLCEEKNIQLIHIWEDDLCYKKNIVHSIISNRLKLTKNKIYARECSIIKVKLKDSKKFLNDNHIQGNCNSTIKIGLSYNNILVSVMTFNRNGDIYELSRFCNLLNTNVIGGASKLFKYFIKNNNFEKIISYSDRSIFNGYLYKCLGFVNTKITNVNYKWIIGNKREHKSKYRKNRLIMMGYDKDKSETEIMKEYFKSNKIWDCGLLKWEYK